MRPVTLRTVTVVCLVALAVALPLAAAAFSTKKGLLEWHVWDVVNWVSSLNPSFSSLYAKTFERNRIDGQRLSSFLIADFEALGVSPVHALTFERALGKVLPLHMQPPPLLSLRNFARLGLCAFGIAALIAAFTYYAELTAYLAAGLRDRARIRQLSENCMRGFVLGFPSLSLGIIFCGHWWLLTILVPALLLFLYFRPGLRKEPAPAAKKKIKTKGFKKPRRRTVQSPADGDTTDVDEGEAEPLQPSQQQSPASAAGERSAAGGEPDSPGAAAAVPALAGSDEGRPAAAQGGEPAPDEETEPGAS